MKYVRRSWSIKPVQCFEREVIKESHNPPCYKTSLNPVRKMNFASNQADRIWENLGINAWISPMRVLPLRPENKQRLQPDCPDLG